MHLGYAGDDEVRLRAEINVPTSLIGRLVGKGGQNVRQLQQTTGATIKLPEDSQQTSASEVPVKIFGTFQASQVNHFSFFFERFDLFDCLVCSTTYSIDYSNKS